MTVADLISALTTLVDDCPDYLKVPILVQCCDARGRISNEDVGIHHDDGAGDDGPPTRLLLTVIPENMGDD